MNAIAVKREMPMTPAERMRHFLAEWWETRALPVLRKAPRDRPDLFFVALLCAVVLVGLLLTAGIKGP